ncbi:hypothetical protein [Pyrodictium abyssi]|uniref:TrbC/VIRB2 family protein n=1 Tax=Pyrodictium abyssi TaxID=54256 RepID=A0ABM8IYH0_9CREN|nr:hypothetical protein PABY_21310 [Pyrodictium abyssi]
MRIRAALSVAALLTLVSTQLALVAYAQTETTTNVSIPAVEKVVGTADYLAGKLKTLASAVIVIAGLVGVINYATGKGPEWLWRAAMAAVLVAAFFWFIGYVMGG